MCSRRALLARRIWEEERGNATYFMRLPSSAKSCNLRGLKTIALDANYVESGKGRTLFPLSQAFYRRFSWHLGEATWQQQRVVTELEVLNLGGVRLQGKMRGDPVMVTELERLIHHRMGTATAKAKTGKVQQRVAGWIDRCWN
jgi:hypothetical protein